MNAFEFVLEHSVNDQRKGYATMQLVNALIELRDFERITAWIPQLYRTDARYDIRQPGFAECGRRIISSGGVCKCFTTLSDDYSEG